MPKILSPSDKFQVRGLGELVHPGRCLACGSGTCQEGYVDLGTYFEYEGQMYLCAYCMQESAEVLGCLTIAESKELLAKVKDLDSKNSFLAQELSNALERLAAFDLALKPVIAGNQYSGSDLVGDEPLPESDGHVITGVNFGGTPGEPETTEPVNEQGRNDTEQPQLGNGLDDL